MFEPPMNLSHIARGLRKRSTDAERKLWTLLRSSQFDGHKFRRQHPIGRYIVDFVCLQAHIVIELDGSQHMEAQRQADSERDAWLAGRGYRVLRFTDTEVLRETDGVANALLAAFHGHPSP